MAGKFVIEKAKDGQFYFNIKASNGQVILTSEMYKAKSGATNGIESIQKNAADDGNYERKEAKNGNKYMSISLSFLFSISAMNLGDLFQLTKFNYI